jgi:hypothetical protein
MHDGDRPSEYIGACENRIAEARTGIGPGMAFDQLSTKLKRDHRPGCAGCD